MEDGSTDRDLATQEAREATSSRLHPLNHRLNEGGQRRAKTRMGYQRRARNKASIVRCKLSKYKSACTCMSCMPQLVPASRIIDLCKDPITISIDRQGCWDPSPRHGRERLYIIISKQPSPQSGWVLGWINGRRHGHAGRPGIDVLEASHVACGRTSTRNRCEGRQLYPCTPLVRSSTDY